MKEQPIFFADKLTLRKWFQKNHKTADELWLGYYKTATGRASVSWSESVDEALCVGWIDGIRKSIDEYSYKIRFTRRNPRSIWSAVNVAKVEALTKEGRMLPEGIASFEKLKEHKSVVYSHENKEALLHAAYKQQFEANKKAWEYFSSQAPSYRSFAIHHIISAKQEATRQRRLEKLMAACERKEKFWLGS
jgi:uncharacterized protein YdeI (YjbR/CyaY-like superfamily)